MVYMPKDFREDSVEALDAFMAEYPFATVVTQGPDGLNVSHIPLLLDPARRVLRGHVAAQNPQAADFRRGGAALAIFHGPHAYVSPRWYETHPAVPTWNYAAVHATGAVRGFDDPAWLGAMVADLSARFEAGAERPWRYQDLPERYTVGMLKYIVGFELSIERLEGKFKLSQNRNAKDRANVVEALGASASPEDQAVARLMVARGS